MEEMERATEAAERIAQRYGPAAANQVMAAGPAHAEELAGFADLLPILDEATYVVVAADAISASARAASPAQAPALHARVVIVHAEAARRHVAAGHAESCQGVRLYALAHRRAVRDTRPEGELPPLPECTCPLGAAGADRRRAPGVPEPRTGPTGAVATPPAVPPVGF